MKKKALIALGTTLAVTLAGVSVVHAGHHEGAKADQVQQSSSSKAKDKGCGTGKCGANHDKAMKAKKGDKSCGHSCGTKSKKAKKAKTSQGKCGAGKCGQGKCG